MSGCLIRVLAEIKIHKNVKNDRFKAEGRRAKGEGEPAKENEKKSDV